MKCGAANLWKSPARLGSCVASVCPVVLPIASWRGNRSSSPTGIRLEREGALLNMVDKGTEAAESLTWRHVRRKPFRKVVWQLQMSRSLRMARRERCLVAGLQLEEAGCDFRDPLLRETRRHLAIEEGAHHFTFPRLLS
jgi:hypothetical protein